VTERDLLSERAAELRRAFDRSFAEAPQPDAAASEHLLLVRIGGDPYALRLVECAGLFADHKVTPLPTRVPELLGLASFRTTLVPVYDLRPLLGYPCGESPRWMISTTGSVVVGLAFDVFDGHARVERDSLVMDSAPAKRHVDCVVRLSAGSPRPVLSLASVLQGIDARVRSDQ
jgi:chemotaxis signal transduction protein